MHALNLRYKGIQLCSQCLSFSCPGLCLVTWLRKKKLFLAPLEVKRGDPGNEVKGHLQGRDFYVYNQLNRLLIKKTV